MQNLNTVNINEEMVVQPNTITYMFYNKGKSTIQERVINCIIRALQNNMTETINFANGQSINSVIIDTKDIMTNNNREKVLLAILGSREYRELAIAENRTIYLPASEDGSKEYEGLIGKGVWHTVINQQSGKKSSIYSIPFTRMEIMENSTRVKICVNPEFMPCLLYLGKGVGYTIYDYQVAQKFKSSYSGILYKNFCMCQDKEYFPDRQGIETGQLIRLLGLPEKTENKQLKRTLQKCVTEINDSESIIKCDNIEFITSAAAKLRSKSKPRPDIVRFHLKNTNPDYTISDKQRYWIKSRIKSFLTDELKIESDTVDRIIKAAEKEKHLKRIHEQCCSVVLSNSDGLNELRSKLLQYLKPQK